MNPETKTNPESDPVQDSNQKPTNNIDPETVTLSKTELSALLDKLDHVEALANQYREDLQRVLSCLGNLAPVLGGGGPASLLKTLGNPKKLASVRQALSKDLFPVLDRYQPKLQTQPDNGNQSK